MYRFNCIDWIVYIYIDIWYVIYSFISRALAIWYFWKHDPMFHQIEFNMLTWLAGKHLWNYKRSLASHQKEIAHCQSIFEVKKSSPAEIEWILLIWSWAWIWIKYESCEFDFINFSELPTGQVLCFEQDPRDAERQAALASIRALSGHNTSRIQLVRSKKRPNLLIWLNIFCHRNCWHRNSFTTSQRWNFDNW